MSIVTWNGHSPSEENKKKYGARAYHQDSIQMCDWIAHELTWGIEHGWHPTYPVTSGYRPGTDPHTSSGKSNHQGTDWNNGQLPCGAIDFGGYDSPEGYKTKKALIDLAERLNYKGHRLMMPLGFHDDGHCSGNGH